MKSLDVELDARLAALKEQGLYRSLRHVQSAQGRRIQLNGEWLLNFSSNDYLGLADDPVLKEAAIKGVERCGAGAGASRLICGSLSPCHELEQTLAAFKGTEAALSFSTGYAAALGAICGLMSKTDVVVLDKLVHACIVDAARLSGAKLRVFPHNDLNGLEEILRWADQHPRGVSATREERTQVLIVTESLFSMDGDQAPLRELVRLKEKYGAWLMIDEAHSTGVYGPSGQGLAAELKVNEAIEIQMGTLGKALGAAGGFICGSRTMIDYLINRARSFVFSTAPVPAAAAAATAGIHFSQSAAGEERRGQLWQRVDEFIGQLAGDTASTHRAAIIPVLIGDETEAVRAAEHLRQQGLFVPAIRYPTVARGAARLRVTLSAAHTSEDVAELTGALEDLRHMFPRTQESPENALVR